MADELFVTSDTFSLLLGYVGDYVAFGFGLAACFWVVGVVFSFARDFLMMGGVD